MGSALQKRTSERAKPSTITIGQTLKSVLGVSQIDKPTPSKKFIASVGPITMVLAAVCMTCVCLYIDDGIVIPYSTFDLLSSHLFYTHPELLGILRVFGYISNFSTQDPLRFLYLQYAGHVYYLIPELRRHSLRCHLSIIYIYIWVKHT